MRLMRRSSRADQVRSRLDGMLGDQVQQGRELAAQAAARAQLLARDVSEDARGRLPARPVRRKQPSTAKRVGVALVLAIAVVAVATAVYAWWRRQRQDEEYARLQQEPDQPNVSPAAPDAPAQRLSPEAGPASERTPQPAATPWTASTSAPAAPAAEPAHAEQPAGSSAEEAPRFTPSTFASTAASGDEASAPLEHESEPALPASVLPPRRDESAGGGFRPFEGRAVQPTRAEAAPPAERRATRLASQPLPGANPPAPPSGGLELPPRPAAPQLPSSLRRVFP